MEMGMVGECLKRRTKRYLWKSVPMSWNLREAPPVGFALLSYRFGLIY
jgi:hypothetical protein